MRSLMTVATLALMLGTGCNDVNDPDGDNEEEVITTVGLVFTPQGGGDTVNASWADPENDGSPVIDDITLAAGTTYDLAVTFTNELADPAEDITEEVEAEDDEHQVFYLGSAVEGPANVGNAEAVATHAYADNDGEGNPVGLANTVEATTAGSGEFQVVLRHLPPEDGTPIKVAGLARTVSDSGVGTLPGDSDVDVTFDLTVE